MLSTCVSLQNRKNDKDIGQTSLKFSVPPPDTQVEVKGSPEVPATKSNSSMQTEKEDYALSTASENHHGFKNLNHITSDEEYQEDTDEEYSEGDLQDFSAQTHKVTENLNERDKVDESDMEQEDMIRYVHPDENGQEHSSMDKTWTFTADEVSTLIE